MTTADLRGIAEVAPRVRAGDVSPVDLVTGCLAQIEARPTVNAFISVLKDSALQAAAVAERDIRVGRYHGPLHGIPIAVKDLIDVAGTPTTAGSAVPSKEAAIDAPVVRRLREAGAIIIGKTNLHEFAFGTTSDESAFGPVRNPIDESRSAGGSSSGSAAALAAGMCFGALGTDTGGSIRIPSAACGTFGLKPTFDEISCDGIVPLAVSLDHVGPMARSVEDLGLLYQALKGMTGGWSLETKERFVFGVPKPYFFDRLESGARDAVTRACEALAAAGHDVVDVEIAHASWTPHVYLHLVLAEAAWYHAPLLEQHGTSYSPGVRLRLEMGRYVLGEDYVRASRLRDVLRREVSRALEPCDALLLPALPIPAPLLGASTVAIDQTIEPVRAVMLRLTQLFNVTGHPAIAMPARWSPDSMPRGLQLVGALNHTPRLLEIAAAVEPQICGGPGSVGGGTG
jgi:aspartyl-tRNA(Asn)/glutamyl-tRNA(Gln) amidotransferase subunit A